MVHPRRSTQLSHMYQCHAHVMLERAFLKGYPLKNSFHIALHWKCFKLFGSAPPSNGTLASG